MDRKSRAEKLQRLRKNQGLTQEALAEKASINLRSLQRIEQGETEPRGHTLRQLALALSQTPEEMTQLYVQQETPKPDLQADATSLQLLNLSALAFWVVPFGNLLIPFVLWRLNRDKVTGVRELGGRLSRFQFVWSCLAYGLLLTTIGCAIVHPVGMNPLVPFDLLIGVGVLCLLNSGLILMASFQIKKGHRAFYMKTPVIFRRPITT